MKKLKEILRLESADQMTPEQLARANKSSIKRKVGGKFGMPVVHQKADELYKSGVIKPSDPAHDFGAGKYMSEVSYHRDQGRNWTGHDVGANITPQHNQEELNKPKSKKLITMGNVVNTLPNQKVVHSVISQAKGMMRDDGVLIVNHPREPRYHEEDIPFHDILKSHFGSVEKSKGNVFVCKNPIR